MNEYINNITKYIKEIRVFLPLSENGITTIVYDNHNVGNTIINANIDLSDIVELEFHCKNNAIPISLEFQ